MAKVVINGEIQAPIQKVKLTQFKSPVEINKEIKKKSEEQRNEQELPDNQEPG